MRDRDRQGHLETQRAPETVIGQREKGVGLSSACEQCRQEAQRGWGQRATKLPFQLGLDKMRSGKSSTDGGLESKPNRTKLIEPTAVEVGALKKGEEESHTGRARERRCGNPVAWDEEMAEEEERAAGLKERGEVERA